MLIVVIKIPQLHNKIYLIYIILFFLNKKLKQKSFVMAKKSFTFLLPLLPKNLQNVDNTKLELSTVLLMKTVSTALVAAE